jgi:hypothetical protein
MACAYARKELLRNSANPPAVETESANRSSISDCAPRRALSLREQFAHRMLVSVLQLPMAYFLNETSYDFCNIIDNMTARCIIDPLTADIAGAYNAFD